MPIGPYENFAACVAAQKAKGKSEESANKICGEIEKNMPDMQNSDSLLHFLTRVVYAEGGFNKDAEFEILTTAKQTDPRYGDFQYSKDDLEQMARNFNENILGRRVALDENHDEAGIAIGWLCDGSMSVKPSTMLQGEYSLFCKLCDYTPRGEELMSTGAMRYFSVELRFELEKFVDGVKRIFNNVIVGLALTNRPVIKDMAPTYSETKSNLQSNLQKAMNMLMQKFDKLYAKGKKVSAAELSEFKKESDKALAEAESKDEKASISTMYAELEARFNTFKKLAEDDSAGADEGKEGEGEGEGESEDEGEDEGSDEEGKGEENKEGEEGDESDEGEDEGEGEEEDKGDGEGKEGGGAGTEGAGDQSNSEAEITARILSEVSKAGGKKLSAAEMETIVKSAVSPIVKKLNEQMVEMRDKRLAEEVEALCLSEQKSIGIKPAAKASILAFVKKLSEPLAKEYFKAHSNVIASVDFSEKGANGDGKQKTKLTPVQELSEKTKKYMEKTGEKDFRRAQAEVLDQDKDLAERVQKAEPSKRL